MCTWLKVVCEILFRVARQTSVFLTLQTIAITGLMYAQKFVAPMISEEDKSKLSLRICKPFSSLDAEAQIKPTMY